MGVDATMFVKTREAVTDEQIVRSSYDACAAFGYGSFLISRPGGAWPARRAFSVETEHWQSGAVAAPGEKFVIAHIVSRWWGPGYERGDLPLLLALAEWLERRFPSGEVWYGNDSGEAFHFDAKKRAAFLDHFASEHGADYWTDGWNDGRAGPPCDFCVHPMTCRRQGGNSRGYVCLGCNLHMLIYDDGRTDSAVGHYPDELGRRVAGSV